MIYHCILNLDLLSDRSNTERFSINVKCTTAPADMKVHLERSLSGAADDPNEAVRLVISSITRIPLEQTPSAVQKAGAKIRAQGVRDPITNGVVPFVAIYFTCAEGEGLHVGLVLGVVPVWDWQMEFVSSNPKVTRKSSIFGESVADMDMETILSIINNYIEGDRDNQLRLRADPQGTAPA